MNKTRAKLGAVCLALVALAGCNQMSEERAHEAFIWACKVSTLRHSMTTQGDTAEFRATCEVSK